MQAASGVSLITWCGLCMMRWKSASSIDSASSVTVGVSGKHRPLPHLTSACWRCRPNDGNYWQHMMCCSVACRATTMNLMKPCSTCQQPTSEFILHHRFIRLQESCAIAKMSTRCTIRQYAHGLKLESPFVPSSTDCWTVRAKIRQKRPFRWP